MKKLMILSGSLAACVFGAMAETIDVPAGQTVKVEAGRVFTGAALVKTGAGTLDLTGAALRNAGLEIREGAVRLEGGKKVGATTRYVRWTITKTRPGKGGAPEYANSGAQFAEFLLFKDGKPVALPAKAKAIGSGAEGCEGTGKGIDGNVDTKSYSGSPLVVDFGEELSFDGYSYVTANDAIGRDPVSWRLEAGVADADDAQIGWSPIAGENDFTPVKERKTAVGKIFPVSACDVVPYNYPVTVCGKGRLVLRNVNETLETASGTGEIALEGSSSIAFTAGATFAGTVSGSASVVYQK